MEVRRGARPVGVDHPGGAGRGDERAVGISLALASAGRRVPRRLGCRPQPGLGPARAVALDRAINGERETIERNGYLVAERRKPCSDRLLIHLLAARERAQAAARADRAEAHRLALAEAKVAAIQARAANAGRRTPAPPPPLPEPPTAATAETASLAAFRALGNSFTPWPELDEAMIEHAERCALNAGPQNPEPV